MAAATEGGARLTPLALVQPPGAARWRQRLAAMPGTRWALACADSHRFAALLYGAWQAGKTVVLPGDVQPATLARLKDEVDGWLGDLPGALPEPGPEPAADAPVATPLPADAALVLYTSGTHGEPLAIAKRLAQLDAEVQALEAAFGPRLPPGTTVAGTVSHQHIYGLLFRVLWPLASGRRFDAHALPYLEALLARRDQGPLALVASPAHLSRLPPALQLADETPLCALFSSGGPLAAAASRQALQQLGQSPIEVLGSSETGGIAWRQREAADEPPWAPLPGVAWRMADEGRLAVRSPHLPDAQWHLTADRAAAQGQGFVLLGRADRIVKVGEKRVALARVEAALLDGPELSAARALALPGDSHLAAVAVPTPAGQALLDAGGPPALAAVLRARLPHHLEGVAQPRRWRFVAELPHNTQGKTTQALLEALFDSAAPPTVQWLERTPTTARLRLRVPPTAAVLDGHFPGQPILPGVAQLDWTLRWAATAFGLAPDCRTVEALKFVQPIVPATDVEVELNWQPERGRLAFAWRSAAGAHASGRCLMAPGANE